MRTSSTKVRFGEIAVVAQDLKLSLWIPLCLQPTIDTCTSKSFIFPVRCPIIVDMIYTQKSPIVNTAANTFSPIGFYNCSTLFGTTSAVYCSGFFGVFLSPCFRMRTISLFLLVVVLTIIGFVSCLLAAQSFFGIKFLCHMNILS